MNLRIETCRITMEKYLICRRYIELMFAGVNMFFGPSLGREKAIMVYYSDRRGSY